jgi:hypothetical protein
MRKGKGQKEEKWNVTVRAEDEKVLDYGRKGKLGTINFAYCLKRKAGWWRR